FPTIAFGKWEPLAVAVVAGSALALTWSGLALRKPRTTRAAAGGIDLLVSPLVPRKAWVGCLMLVLLPLLTFAALAAVERTDWNFLVQKTIVVLEWTFTFGMIFGLTARMRARSSSLLQLAAPPLVGFAVFTAVAGLSPALLAGNASARQ